MKSGCQMLGSFAGGGLRAVEKIPTFDSRLADSAGGKYDKR
jgi:hypothetical protein